VKIGTLWFDMTTTSTNKYVPSLAGEGESTVQPPIIQAGTKAGLHYPEFMAHEEVTRVFGLKRSHLYQLKDMGLIKSVSLRAKGALKGRRLFHVESIRRLLYRNIEGVPASHVQEEVNPHEKSAHYKETAHLSVPKKGVRHVC
jgi:hypothetical protein